MTNPSQPRRTGWTEARLARLVELWNARLSAAQIAHQLGDGLSRSAVVGKLLRLGLTRDAGERRTARVAGAQQTRRKRRANIAPDRLRPPDLPAEPFVATTESGLVPKLAGILELRPWSCRWPYAMGEETRYCGHPARAGGPYCPGHHRRAYVAVLPPFTPEQIEALAERAR